MKFKPATQPRGFQPIQLSRAGIQELRIRDNRIINNMQNIFNAEKDQQDRDRAAMQENAKLELDRIQRDRAIEVDNLKNEELALSQQAKVDIKQDRYDAKAANTFFDSIAEFSKTAVAKAAENHANMVRDQEEAARKADITKERQEARKAYEALSKGAIRSDTDALEYASETGEPFIKTLELLLETLVVVLYKIGSLLIDCIKNFLIQKLLKQRKAQSLFILMLLVINFLA